VSTTSACQTESIEVKIQDGDGENVSNGEYDDGFDGEYDDGFDGEYYNGFDEEYDDGFDGDKYADDENKVENLSCQAVPRAANRAPSSSANLESERPMICQRLVILKLNRKSRCPPVPPARVLVPASLACSPSGTLGSSTTLAPPLDRVLPGALLLPLGLNTFLVSANCV